MTPRVKCASREFLGFEHTVGALLKTATAPAILVNFKASVNSTDVLVWIYKYQTWLNNPCWYRRILIGNFWLYIKTKISGIVLHWLVIANLFSTLQRKVSPFMFTFGPCQHAHVFTLRASKTFINFTYFGESTPRINNEQCGHTSHIRKFLKSRKLDPPNYSTIRGW